jgi:hypothetical protein
MGFLNKLYSYIARPVGTTPGVGNMAFYQNTTFPDYDVRGAGRPVYNQFSAFAPQIIQTPVVTPEGFGGLYTGQYVSQPLSDDPNNNGGA